MPRTRAAEPASALSSSPVSAPEAPTSTRRYQIGDMLEAQDMAGRWYEVPRTSRPLSCS